MSRRDAVNARISLGLRHLIADAVIRNERIARSVGVNVVDLQTLSLLVRAGGTLTTGELAARTALPLSTMTRVVDRLVQAGLAQRETDPDDRRRVLVTAKVEALLNQDDNPYDEIERDLFALNEGFSVAELATVARYLEAMNAVSWDGEA